MKNKLLAFTLCFLTAALCVLCAPSAYADTTDMQRAEDIYNGIVASELSADGADSIQSWIDGGLTKGVGATSEWFILALCQSGDYSFSAYEAALLDYLGKNEVYSAASRQKYALCISGIGGTDGYISAVLENSIGEQGIMSYIYGLHLLNNGYRSTRYTCEQLTEKLLSLRCNSGGWALGGNSADTDITAMAVQALAPHYKNEAVKKAVDGALVILSERQLNDGDYSSYGVSNPESTAQVIVALSSLGIDCQTDARFIKNGKTLFDGIEKYRLADGGFSHKLGDGKSGSATAQVFYAVTAYMRNADGRSPLYVLDKSRPADVQPAPITEASGGTADDASVDTDSQNAVISADTGNTATARRDYKPYAVLAIAVLGATVCLVLFIFKRRNVKSYIAVILVTAICIAVVCFTDIRTPDSYYGVSVTKENPIGTVTLTIRCDTVAGDGNSEYIPADGVILGVTELEIEEGDTVYSVLTDAARAYGIHIETSGSASLTYVSGINYLYEFDFGDLSGWVYRVNGVTPDVGCGEYRLSDSDCIEWHYTKELGNDIS